MYVEVITKRLFLSRTFQPSSLPLQGARWRQHGEPVVWMA